MSNKEKLQIEIELLEWLFEKTEDIAYKEMYHYAFSLGVLQEKKAKLKECDRK